MALFYTEDVKYYLSGGALNRETSKSLGGAPSDEQVGDSLNNLFGREKLTGGTTYRCMYIFNVGATVMENTKIWIEQNAELSDIDIGIAFFTEVQQITLSGTPTGGDFKLRYTANVEGIQVSQNTDEIPFSSTAITMANNIQNALNDLDLLSEVTVTATFTTAWIYRVTFGGIHNYREHQTLTVIQNHVTGSDIALSTQTITEGHPVNAIAADIGFENQPPNGVSFTRPDQLTALTIGTLSPLDGFAVWLRRTSLANTTGNSDSVIIKLAAQVEI